jgi:hypothetical protein
MDRVMNKLKAPFPISVLPDRAAVISGNMDFSFPLSRWQACELFVAHYLDAMLALPCHTGYDVYGSRMFPGLTFQIKYATAYQRDKSGIDAFNAQKGYDPVLKVKPSWCFTAPQREAADFYVLLGSMNDRIYPFVMAQDESPLARRDGKRRGLIICTSKQVRCGHGKYRQAKYWNHSIKAWPDDLYSYIEAKTTGKQ